MLGLLVRDLRRHAGQWVWALVIAAVAGACAGAQTMITRGAVAAARAAGRKEMIEGAYVFQGWTLTAVAISAITVLGLVAALIVRQRERAHGLWRALGMRPRSLRAILLAQLALVAACGVLVGQVGSWPLARLLLPIVVRQRVVLPSTALAPSVADLPVVVALAVAVALLGGRRATRRSTRAQVVALLRGLEEPGRRGPRGGARAGLALGCLAGLVACALAATQVEPGTDKAIGVVLAASFSAVATVLVAAPWIVPAAERALAALLAAGSPTWFLARQAASHQAARSVATVMPFTIAAGLIGMFYPMRAFGATGISAEGLFAMFGPALIVAWTGGLAVIAMGAAQRRRDAALLVAAGARPVQVRTAQVLEAVVHAVTTTALGGLIAAAVQVVGYLAWDGRVPPLRVVAYGPWRELGLLGAATAVVMAGAVVATSTDVGRSAVQTLRARD